jgi:hypothetical protein
MFNHYGWNSFIIIFITKKIPYIFSNFLIFIILLLIFKFIYPFTSIFLYYFRIHDDIRNFYFYFHVFSKICYHRFFFKFSCFSLFLFLLIKPNIVLDLILNMISDGDLSVTVLRVFLYLNKKFKILF